MCIARESETRTLVILSEKPMGLRGGAFKESDGSTHPLRPIMCYPAVNWVRICLPVMLEADSSPCTSCARPDQFCRRKRGLERREEKETREVSLTDRSTVGSSHPPPSPASTLRGHSQVHLKKSWLSLEEEAGTLVMVYTLPDWFKVVDGEQRGRWIRSTKRKRLARMEARPTSP